MALLENLVLVFVAALLTDFATGLGATPFFFVDDFSDRWNVALWGLASGITLSASLFGLIAEGTPLGLLAGVLVGVVLVVSGELLDRVDVGAAGEAATGGTVDETASRYAPDGGGRAGETEAAPGRDADGDHRSGGDHDEDTRDGSEGPGRHDVHDDQDGELHEHAEEARAFVPYGFAAGGMIHLVATELVPEGLEYGEHLSTKGYPAMAGGLLAGFAVVLPLSFL